MKETLKKIYRKQNTIPQLIENLSGEEQSIRDYYIKLNILLSESQSHTGSSENISGKQEAIELKDIFDKSGSDKILILGGAGVGKSTLMQHIAYCWSNNELWRNKFDYVYKLSLKQLLIESCKTFIASKDGARLEAFIAYNLANGDIDIANELYNSHKSEDEKIKREIIINDKTLIITDGYDEVKHLNYQSLEYQIIKNAMMDSRARHKLIMTSRPNAADKAFKNNFGALIKNEGLDQDGINEYIEKQFKDNNKANKVTKLLDTQPHIKELCKIPVNIAMLCSIFTEDQGGSDDISKVTVEDITNMGDLYQQIIATLGKRFYNKHHKYTRADTKKEIIEKLNNGRFDINELKVLQNLASHAFKNDEALSFRGASNNIEDKKDNTVQAAINRTSAAAAWSQYEKPTISDIYKYGILKSETSQMSAGQDEIYLQRQLFSFVHLTFQEYLAAYEIIESILSYRDDQGNLPKYNPEIARICEFLACNRDNPKYLMLLKFMSGLVSKEGNQDLTTAFWESMTCNLDGELNLGNNQRVEMFMHLLGHIDKKDYKKIIDKIRLELEKDSVNTKHIIEELYKVLQKPSDNQIDDSSTEAKKEHILQYIKHNAESVNTDDKKLAINNINHLANSIWGQKSYIYNLLQQLTNEIPNLTLIEKFIDRNVTKTIDNVYQRKEMIKSTNYLSPVMQDKLFYSDNLDLTIDLIGCLDNTQKIGNDTPYNYIAKNSLELLNNKETIPTACQHVVNIISFIDNQDINKFTDRIIQLIEGDITSNHSFHNYMKPLGKALASILTRMKNLADLKEDYKQSINRVNDILENLLKKIEGGGENATYAAQIVDKLSIYKIINEGELSTVYYRLLNKTIDEGNAISVEAAKIVSSFPLDKLNVGSIFTTCKKLLTITKQSRANSKYAAEAIGKLLNTLTTNDLSEVCSQLISIVGGQDEDSSKYAAEAIVTSLTADTLDTDEVLKHYKNLIEIVVLYNQNSIHAAECIAVLPLDKFSSGHASLVLKEIHKSLGRIKGKNAEYAIKAVGKLPINNLDLQMLKKILDELIQNVKNTSGVLTEERANQEGRLTKLESEKYEEQLERTTKDQQKCDSTLIDKKDRAKKQNDDIKDIQSTISKHNEQAEAIYKKSQEIEKQIEEDLSIEVEQCENTVKYYDEALQSANANQKSQEQELETLEDKHSQYLDKLKELKQEEKREETAEKLRREVQKLTEERDDSVSKYNKLMSDKNDIDAKLKTLEDEKSKYHSDLEEAKKELAAAEEKELEVIQQKRDDSVSKYNKLMSDKNDIDAKLKTLEGEKSKYHIALEKGKKELEEAEKVSSTTTAMTKQKEELYAKDIKIAEEIQRKNQEQESEKQREVQDKERILGELKEKKKNVEKNIISKTEKYNEAITDYQTSAEKKLNEALEEQKKMDVELNKAKNLQKNLPDQIKNVKSQLEQTKQKKKEKKNEVTELSASVQEEELEAERCLELITSGLSNEQNLVQYFKDQYEQNDTELKEAEIGLIATQNQVKQLELRLKEYEGHSLSLEFNNYSFNNLHSSNLKAHAIYLKLETPAHDSSKNQLLYKIQGPYNTITEGVITSSDLQGVMMPEKLNNNFDSEAALKQAILNITSQRGHTYTEGKLQIETNYKNKLDKKEAEQKNLYNIIADNYIKQLLNKVKLSLDIEKSAINNFKDQYEQNDTELKEAEIGLIATQNQVKQLELRLKEYEGHSLSLEFNNYSFNNLYSSDLKAHAIYLKLETPAHDSSKNQLLYKIQGPDNTITEGVITSSDLQSVMMPEKLNNNFDSEAALKQAILNITSQRGHTYEGKVAKAQKYFEEWKSAAAPINNKPSNTKKYKSAEKKKSIEGILRKGCEDEIKNITKILADKEEHCRAAKKFLDDIKKELTGYSLSSIGYSKDTESLEYHKLYVHLQNKIKLSRLTTQDINLKHDLLYVMQDEEGINYKVKALDGKVIKGVIRKEDDDLDNFNIPDQLYLYDLELIKNILNITFKRGHTLKEGINYKVRALDGKVIKGVIRKEDNDLDNFNIPDQLDLDPLHLNDLELTKNILNITFKRGHTKLESIISQEQCFLKQAVEAKRFMEQAQNAVNDDCYKMTTSEGEMVSENKSIGKAAAERKDQEQVDKVDAARKGKVQHQLEVIKFSKERREYEENAEEKRKEKIQTELQLLGAHYNYMQADMEVKQAKKYQSQLSLPPNAEIAGTSLSLSKLQLEKTQKNLSSSEEEEKVGRLELEKALQNSQKTQSTKEVEQANITKIKLTVAEDIEASERKLKSLEEKVNNLDRVKKELNIVRETEQTQLAEVSELSKLKEQTSSFLSGIWGAVKKVSNLSGKEKQPVADQQAMDERKKEIAERVQECQSNKNSVDTIVDILAQGQEVNLTLEKQWPTLTEIKKNKELSSLTLKKFSLMRRLKEEEKEKELAIENGEHQLLEAEESLANARNQAKEIDNALTKLKQAKEEAIKSIPGSVIQEIKAQHKTYTDSLDLNTQKIESANSNLAKTKLNITEMQADKDSAHNDVQKKTTIKKDMLHKVNQKMQEVHTNKQNKIDEKKEQLSKLEGEYKKTQEEVETTKQELKTQEGIISTATQGIEGIEKAKGLVIASKDAEQKQIAIHRVAESQLRTVLESIEKIDIRNAKRSNEQKDIDQYAIKETDIYNLLKVLSQVYTNLVDIDGIEARQDEAQLEYKNAVAEKIVEARGIEQQIVEAKQKNEEYKKDYETRLNEQYKTLQSAINLEEEHGKTLLLRQAITEKAQKELQNADAKMDKREMDKEELFSQRKGEEIIIDHYTNQLEELEENKRQWQKKEECPGKGFIWVYKGNQFKLRSKIVAEIDNRIESKNRLLNELQRDQADQLKALEQEIDDAKKNHTALSIDGRLKLEQKEVADEELKKAKENTSKARQSYALVKQGEDALANREKLLQSLKDRKTTILDSIDGIHVNKLETVDEKSKVFQDLVHLADNCLQVIEDTNIKEIYYHAKTVETVEKAIIRTINSIGRFPIKILDRDILLQGLETLANVINAQGRSADCSVQVIYNIAESIPLENIQLLLEYCETNKLELPGLLDNLSKNIESRSSEEIKDIKDINLLLEIVKDITSYSYEKKVEHAASSLLGKVIVELHEDTNPNKKQILINELRELMQKEGAQRRDALKNETSKPLNIQVDNDLKQSSLEDDQTHILNQPLGQEFITKFYQSILKGRLSEDEIPITKCFMKAGYTTAVSKQILDSNFSKDILTKIIFNGKTYIVQGKGIAVKDQKHNADAYIKGITEFMLSESKDKKTLFENSGHFLPKASGDIGSDKILSVFDSDLKVDYNCLIETRIEEHNAFYEESRDVYGRYNIIKYYSINNDPKGTEIGNWQISPYQLAPQGEEKHFTNKMISIREEIFGKYDSVRNKHYKATVSYQSQEQKQISEDKEKVAIVFHQELLGITGFDRSNYIQYATNKIKQECTILKDQHAELKDDVIYINDEVEKLDESGLTDHEKMKILAEQLNKLHVNPLDIPLHEDSHAMSTISYLSQTIELQKMQISVHKEKMQLIKEEREQFRQYLSNPVKFKLCQIGHVAECNKKEDERVDKWHRLDAREQDDRSTMMMSTIRKQSQEIDKLQTLCHVQDSEIKNIKSHLRLDATKLEDGCSSIGILNTVNEPNVERDNERVALLSSNKEKKQDCLKAANKKCTIFSYTETKYDNELLNHPELIRVLVSKYTANTAVDIINLIDLDLQKEIVETNNYELLLSGADSVIDDII